ncbi:MAG: hypothetical protein NTX91_01770 [candidate division SR1 bacterium]|nr:hypothetical protein [candidate division SR1 bacterium]
MSHHVKSLLAVCDQLIHKPTNVCSKSHDEHIHTITANAHGSVKEFSADLETRLFYTHTKHNISIHLYKNLSEGYFFTNVTDPTTRNILAGYPDVVRQHDLHCRVPMHPGDISLGFDNSLLSHQVNTNHSFLTYGALIKDVGEKCFVTGTSTDEYKDNRLLLATADDLEKILSYLESLL